MMAGTIHEKAIFIPERPGYPEEKWGWVGAGTLGQEGNPGSGFYYWQSISAGIRKKLDTIVEPNASVRVLVQIKCLETPTDQVQVTGEVVVVWPVTDKYGLYSLYVKANPNGEVNLQVNLKSENSFRISTVEVWSPV